MSASLAATLSIMFNALAAMIKIFLVSAVGIFLAKYPRGDPILPPLMIKYLSKLTNNVFVPALIITSLGSAITIPLLSRIGILVCFSFVTNIISYCFGYSFGRLLHGRSDDPMFVALIVAIGSPNAISLPIMVMQTMCEESYVKKDYDNNQDKCFAEATSMLFVYSMGWHLMFWSYGFPKLKSIRKRFYSELSIINDEMAVLDTSVAANNSGSKIEYFLKKIDFYKNKSAFLDWLKTVFLTPAMIAIFIGVAIGLIPFAQELMFQKMSFLRPLGSAITTLGEPVVAVNCLVMSASLAQVDFSNCRDIDRIENNENNSTNIEMTEQDSNVTHDTKETTSKSQQNDNSLIPNFLKNNLPSLKLIGIESRTYSRLVGEEDIEANNYSVDESEINELSTRSSFVIENGDNDDDDDREEKQTDFNDSNNNESKENSEFISSNVDDQTQKSLNGLQKNIGVINNDDMMMVHNDDNIKNSLITKNVSVQDPKTITQKKVEIPPPTFGSIIALIVCR